MKHGAILLLAGYIGGVPVLCAQEQVHDGIVRIEAGDIAGKARETLRWYFSDSRPAWTDTGWLREEVDPIQRARRALRSRMDSETDKVKAAAIATARPRDPSITTEGMRITIGNNPSGNWSPYPDRALDARAITFPLPRHARADKRTK